MKIKKVTKEFYELEDGRVFNFDEPLKKVPSPAQLQKMMDKNKELVEGLKKCC